MNSTNLVKRNLFTKPYLITLDELNQIGQDINLVGYDPQLNLTSDDSNITLKYGIPCSPKILNWIEPYEIAGINYSLFYTEVNSGFKIGDRVFIINGTYDSNLLIQSDKYKKGHDGYKVLFVDRCQVVLDIEFTGSLPSNDGTEPSDDYDNLVKIYYVKDQNDFIHVNRQITTRGGTFDYRFNQNQNNIIFTDNDFSPTGPWGQSDGLVGSPGFFIKDGTASWINITNDFLTGSYSMATASGSIDKVLILNNSFTIISDSNIESSFKENLVYSFETTGTFSSWQVNVKHENKNVPIMSKSNFRKGTFNGTWNGGIYGSNDERIYWSSTSSVWNSGTLLNTIWERGIMESKQSQPESFVSEFDNIVGTFGAPYQKSTNPDNDGYGYNFIINSEIRNAIINNGNVSNSLLINGSTFSVVEEHLKGTLTSQFIQDNFSDTLVTKALFDNCGIQNSNIQNSIVKNSRVENSRFFNIKSINTHYKKSLFKNSNYISDNAIRILHFSENFYSESSSGIKTHKVYKFYINKRSYEKFKFKDTFYIKGIKINNNSGELLNFFDKKFKIGPFTDYIDKFDNNNKRWYKRGFEYNCTLSTPLENEYSFDVNGGNIINNIDTFGYSIDIYIKLTDINGILGGYYNLSNIIDFTDAYILNSDFESGVFENSNWNSGNYINFSNDVNITYSDYSTNPQWYIGGLTGDVANSGGYYDMTITNTSTLMVKTSYAYPLYTGNRYSEIENDYLSLGEIVFLNDVDYDTRGKVITITYSSSGLNYIDGTNLSTAYTGTGSGLLVDITTSGIGEVTGFTVSSEGSGYPGGLNIYSTSTTGAGTGLEFSMVDGDINTLTITTNGLGYLVGDTVTMLRTLYNPLYSDDIFTITSVNNGAVLSISISQQGLGYSIGDILNILQPNSSGTATFSITGVTGSLTRLPDQYKIIDNPTQGIYELQEIIATGSNSTISGLLSGGKFYSINTNNRYGYLHKTKFFRSKILSGIFRKAYFDTSLIKNELYDVSDRDFSNIEKIKNLLVVDSLFSGNSNILSKATYFNSYFVENSDIWENGIVYNSIWNGMIFTNGLFKSSTWIDGIFSNGLFYTSNSFDGYLLFDYNENNINSFYKSGLTRNGSQLRYNNRLSWQNGTFLNGEFYKSDWENGSLNGGKFYYSKFYNGDINGGIIGDSSILTSYTNIYNGNINYTTVENAELISQPYTQNLAPGNIQWNDGIFNSGIFSTLNNLNSATWSNGIFNGGEFTGTAKWLDGTFNGGKFTSNYGITLLTNNLYTTSDIKENYSWEYGIFNDGEFGTADINNSTWYDGEFNGGHFKGMVWNSGVFSFGEFSGSGKTQSGFYAVGGTESSNAQNFISSFVGGYGIWKDGFVTDTKDKYVNKKIYTDLRRVSDLNQTARTAILRDVLWMSGTFSHPSGTIQNSTWLNGTFENGTFRSSSFNPYVNRNVLVNLPVNIKFNIDDYCIWKNGTLIDSDFYISKWENGNFISGNGYGMIWENGIVNYMNAYNIFWENGLWKNGNWFGSNFELNNDGTITNDFARQILFRGMNWGGTSSSHVWNVFYKELLSDINQSITSIADTISYAPNIDTVIVGNTPPLAPTVFGLLTTNPSTSYFTEIIWEDGSFYGATESITGPWDTINAVYSGIDNYTVTNKKWETYNGISWIYYSPAVSSETFILEPGLNRIRVSGLDSTNQPVYSNILEYTKINLYSINISGLPVTPSNNNKSGVIVVNTTSVFRLKVIYGSNSGGNTIGRINIIGLGIYNTPIAYGTNTTFIDITIPSGTYNVIISGVFSSSSGEVTIVAL